MLVMQLLRGAVKHAGSRPQCSVERLISAVRGISSSSHQLCAFGRTHPSSCTDTDHPKVLITGWFLHCVIVCVFQAVNVSVSLCIFLIFLLKVSSYNITSKNTDT